MTNGKLSCLIQMRLPVSVLRREHSTRVGDELTALLGALDTPNEMLQMMEQNAMRHCRMGGVEPAHFRQFGQVIVDMLCASYEDHMPPTAMSGWQHFFEVRLN